MNDTAPLQTLPDPTPYLILTASNREASGQIDVEPPVRVSGWDAAVATGRDRLSRLLQDAGLNDEVSVVHEGYDYVAPTGPAPFSYTYVDEYGPFTVTLRPAPAQYLLIVSMTDHDQGTLDLGQPALSENGGALFAEARTLFVQAVQDAGLDRDDGGRDAATCFDQDAGSGPLCDVAFVQDQVTVRAFLTTVY